MKLSSTVRTGVSAVLFFCSPMSKMKTGLIDQIGGRSATSVGQGYGEGYDLVLIQGYLEGMS